LQGPQGTVGTGGTNATSCGAYLRTRGGLIFPLILSIINLDFYSINDTVSTVILFPGYRIITYQSYDYTGGVIDDISYNETTGLPVAIKLRYNNAVSSVKVFFNENLLSNLDVPEVILVT
jgi:hypothetical protein